jgi:hypothetical protein
MFRSPYEDCGTWNHEECVADAILDKMYKRLVEESRPAVNGTEPIVLSSVKASVTKTLVSRGKLKRSKKAPKDGKSLEGGEAGCSLVVR